MANEVYEKRVYSKVFESDMYSYLPKEGEKNLLVGRL